MSSIGPCKLVSVAPLKYVQGMQGNTVRTVVVSHPRACSALDVEMEALTPFQGVWRARSVLPVASAPTGTSSRPPAAPSQASGRSPRPALLCQRSGTFRGLPKSVGCAVKAENTGKGAGSAAEDIHHAWRLVSQRWVWLAP